MATAASSYGLLLLAGCWFGPSLAGRIGDDGVGTLRRGLLLPATRMLVLLGLGAVAGACRSPARSWRLRLAERVRRHRTAIPAGMSDGPD